MTDRVKDLRNKYGEPSERAQKKVLNYMADDVLNYIKESPFAVLSTSNANGDCDASPRGGKPGFVKIIDNKTLIIPDIRGNRLLQSTQNMMENPKVGLVFFIPGNNKTVRVNGSIKLLDVEAVNKYTTTVEVFNPDETSEMIQGLLISVEEAYRHCPRALSFSDLWNVETIKGNR